MKLETMKEQRKYTNIGILFLFVVIYTWGIITNGIRAMLPITCAMVWMLMVVEVICLFFWLPEYIVHEIAIKRGKQYDGIVIKSYQVDRIRMSHGAPMFAYMLEIEINIDGEIKTLDFGKYEEDPYIHFIPENRKCNVYLFNNKYYLERFKR